MGVLLGDVHPSELERLDKACARVGIELATIRSSVDNSGNSAYSLPPEIGHLPWTPPYNTSNKVYLLKLFI